MKPCVARLVTAGVKCESEMESSFTFTILCALAFVVGCAPRPTLEQLENEAMVTGDWTAVEKREERIKAWLEAAGPGCLRGEIKRCFEGQSGIECYCLRVVDERN